MDKEALSAWNSSSLILLALFGCGTSVTLVQRYISRKRSDSARLPPGPKASWLGSVSLPKQYQWRTYAEWKALYGASGVVPPLN